MKASTVWLLPILVVAMGGCGSAPAPSVPPPAVLALSEPPQWRIEQDRAGLFVVCTRCGVPTPKTAWHALGSSAMRSSAPGPGAHDLPPIITIPTVVLRVDATPDAPHAQHTAVR